ncbi:hypothetical protein E4U42_007091 [Claviceps africana]|uniref:Tyrosine-protein phosphatase non-receptor type 6 n=1 Tax=Claviceps africana TaxID=83212 RepID=A0A8K0NIT8_9HYPO|nr:hypothetical protein E4U42_007091 [Claviceps africana]
MDEQHPYYVLRSRRPADATGALHADTPGTNGVADGFPTSATHDISRTSFHVKNIGTFAQRLEESATRAFPNRGRTSQRYKKVQALLLHWSSDDLFVLPELEDLEKCLRQDFAFGTDVFAIPSENSHLELMMRVGQLIKAHESQDTLFLIYYGGHARIDESRQSTWCATRDQSSPWLQWSAIQTLLERSRSDVLILLDCCAGAASATFPNGESITETISASSWDAIAPNPGRFSFTEALIGVLQEWRMRTFSAAMLHAELLARLKHPRPITIDGKHFEARSTPVHFMMTANHKAPSIELSRVLPLDLVTEPIAGPAARPRDTAPPLSNGRVADSGDDAILGGPASHEPNEDIPHVMISLALEDDQQLDMDAWEQWLSSFPALAKYVKVQGVFRSHSTLMLVSLPVMIWDLLPDDPAISFVAFIRSNNLALRRRSMPPSIIVPASSHHQPWETDSHDNSSAAAKVSGTTSVATGNLPIEQQQQHVRKSPSCQMTSRPSTTCASTWRNALSNQPANNLGQPTSQFASSATCSDASTQSVAPTTPLNASRSQPTAPVSASSALGSRRSMLSQQQAMRHTALEGNVPKPKSFSAHVERRLEQYYQEVSTPNDAHCAYIASNLGIELWHLQLWFQHRRERDLISSRLATMKLKDAVPEPSNCEARMILPAELKRLLDIPLPGVALLFDVRSASSYERSHVYGAINLRAPKSFLAAAPLDLIARAIPDEQGRKQLSQWKTAKCLVFYGRGLGSSWECPAAGLITEKLRAQAWTGDCFILRGHYMEFSQSFDKYIVSAKMTPRAKDWISSQATLLTRESDRALIDDHYASWLDTVVGEGEAARRLSASSTRTQESQEALDKFEEGLEAEFRARCGPLFRKAMDIQRRNQGHDNFDGRAEMVGHLDRGLEKMRVSTQFSSVSYNPEHIDLGSEDMSDGHLGKTLEEQDVEDEYVEISKTNSRLFRRLFGSSDDEAQQQRHT